MNNYTTRKKQFEKIEHLLTTKGIITLLFKGFKQTKSYESTDTYYLYFETTVKSTKCQKCKYKCDRNIGFRYVYPIVGIYNNKQVLACFKKRISKCIKCNTSTAQKSPNIDFKKQISNDVINCVLVNLGKTTITYTQVAKDSFISTTTVIRLFDKMDNPKIDYSKYDTIGIDEIRFIKSAGNYQCTIFDAISGLVLEVLHNRESKLVRSYLKKKFPHLKILSQDLWTTYKNAGKFANQNVKIIADMFHVVRTSMWAFNRGRVSHFKESKNKANLRWRTYSYSIAKLDAIDKAIVKHKIAKDPWMQKNHQAKEMFLAACRSKTQEDFKRIYAAFKRYVKKHKLEEYKAVLTMVSNWHEEIINSIESTISNGISERRNSDFKQAKRNARGFMNLPRAVKLVKYRVNSKIDVDLYNAG